MPEAAIPMLAGWESFYVIVGSSAAALTGLQFVVIALGAERRLGGTETVDAFGTPTVVHFCVVLLLAAIVSTPRHTPGTLSLCLALCGAGGLAYACWVVRRARRQKGYAPVLEDWVWHTILPAFAYTCLLIAGLTAWRYPGPALYAVAGTALLLLFIGIHNAWDSAVWITTHPKES